MKIVITIILLIFTTNIYAQTWCPPGAQWYFTRNVSQGNGYTKHTFSNTVTINNKVCQQINYYSKFYTSWNNSVGSYTATIYTYFNNNIVFLYDAISNNFDTLFNYNATIGSKWGLPNKSTAECAKSRVLVTDTGRKVIQGVTLKWFKVSINSFYLGTNQSTLQDTIYERIGCLSKYFYHQFDICPPQTDSNRGGAVRCYTDNQISYKNFADTCNYIFIPTSVNELSDSNVIYKLYPNPTSGTFILKPNNNLEYPKQIIIRDVMGRNVKVIDKPAGYEHELNLEKEPSGIYMITVYYSDKVISKRIIKK